MSHFSFQKIKLSLKSALERLPGFNQLNYQDQGKVIDKTFKSILTDLMQQFGMRPNIDYEDNLRDNEPSTDFVALSKSADELIVGLMEGRIVAIKAHIRTNRNGEPYQVKAHFRKKTVA